MSASVVLQPRDLALLGGLVDARVLTLAHLTALYFDGKPDAAKKRVQKLKAAGLIRERPRRVYEPSVLFLTAKGLQTLQDAGALGAFPNIGLAAFAKRAQVSQTTLQHELAVQNVKVAFVTSIASRAAFSVAEFTTWPLLCEFQARSVPHLPVVLVKPDGFIRLREQGSEGELYEHTYFLEVDRSTETVERLTSRSVAYVDYYRSGGFAVKNGALRESFKEYPFRVLIVLKTASRRYNIAHALLELAPPILTQVWLGVETDVLADPFGRVWLTPEASRSDGTLRSLLTD